MTDYILRAFRTFPCLVSCTCSDSKVFIDTEDERTDTSQLVASLAHRRTSAHSMHLDPPEMHPQNTPPGPKDSAGESKGDLAVYHSPVLALEGHQGTTQNGDSSSAAVGVVMGPPLYDHPVNSENNLIVCKRCRDFIASLWRPYTRDFAFPARDLEPKILSTTLEELTTGSDEGCQWCRFILREVGKSIWEELDDTVTLKLTTGLNQSNVRQGWYYSLHISSTEYYLYTFEDDPCARYVAGRGLLRAVGSEACLEFIRESVNFCLNDLKYHDDCVRLQEPGPVLPTRVVDCADPTHPRLVDTKGARDRYVALSYVWGEDQPHKTQTTNITTYLCGIDLRLLPQTIRDAIWTTHALGVRYLWTDTLCIIQDDDKDRNHELARMTAIYTDAHLTIVAASARRASEGFLQRREDFAAQEDTALPFVLPDGTQGTICASRLRYAPQYVGSEPISGRGWCFQEAVLSARCVIFATHTVMFQCRATTECVGNAGNPSWTDTGQVETLRQFKLPAPGGFGGKAYTSDRMPFQWKALLREYSRTAVTNPVDRLVAFAGVAERFAEAFRGVRYLAGLWEDQLVNHLHWFIETRHPPLLPAPAPRPTYRAPTWSWASVDGGIDFEDLEYVEVTTLAQVVSVETTLKYTELPFGEVTGGFLVLQAPVMACKLQRNAGQFYADALICATEGSHSEEDTMVSDTNVDLIKVGDCMPDSASDAAELPEWGAILVILARRLGYPYHGYVGFVAKRDRGEHYRRIGWFANNGDSHIWNEDNEYKRSQKALENAKVREVSII